MRELFIYYRIRPNKNDAARAAVAEFQMRLRERHPFLRARLLCRPDSEDGRQTWMETYATDPMRDPLGISIDLQAEIETLAAALAPCIDGERHTEAFVACAS